MMRKSPKYEWVVQSPILNHSRTEVLNTAQFCSPTWNPGCGGLRAAALVMRSCLTRQKRVGGFNGGSPAPMGFNTKMVQITWMNRGPILGKLHLILYWGLVCTMGMINLSEIHTL